MSTEITAEKSASPMRFADVHINSIEPLKWTQIDHERPPDERTPILLYRDDPGGPEGRRVILCPEGYEEVLWDSDSLAEWSYYILLPTNVT